MEKELKDFFEESLPSNQIFLFRKLYNNPNSILGVEQELFEVEKEYYNLPRYFDLILNNNLLKFLNIALKDEEYCQKLDIQTCRKLGFFLYDSVDFKTYYKYQKELLELLNNEISVTKIFKKMNLNSSSILDVFELCKKYEKLFKYNYPEEQVINYDDGLSISLKEKLDLQIETIYKRTIEKEQDKEYAFKRIAEDDYDGDLDNVYLYTHGHYDLTSDSGLELVETISFKDIELLACENRFLDIIEELIELEEITGVALDNAMTIVLASIRIKSHNIVNANYFRKRVGDTVIKEFDLKRANSLYLKMNIYKNRIEVENQPRKHKLKRLK